MLGHNEHSKRRQAYNTSVPPIKPVKYPITYSTAPITELHQPIPEKISTDDYIKRVKSIYAPNTAEKTIHKSYRLHSRVSIFKGKALNPESKEEVRIKVFDSTAQADSKLKKGIEIKYDNQRFIVQTNKFNHLTVRLAEKESLAQVREDVIRVLPLIVNNSNAISVLPSLNPRYLFYLGKGNNGDLIRRILITRPWWVQTDEENMLNANFIWTQLLNTKYIQSVPLAEAIRRELDSGNDKLELDTNGLGYSLITHSPSYLTLGSKKVFASASIKLHNRLEFNYNLSDKKHLYRNMKAYYQSIGENVFEYLPLTFHIQFGEEDSEYSEFLSVFEENKVKKTLNLWILKPGENCNRGNGICVCNSIEQIRNELKNNPFPKTGEHTFVIQKYVEKPFLINRRKFDIRLYCMLTSINGYLQAYYYQDGYIRTSCKEYNPKILGNKFIHLTNDAVQKKSEDYGKYEFANKMSYIEFQRYLDSHRPRPFLHFFNDVIPKMKKMVKDSVCAVYNKIDLRKRAYSFEIYGYDFLLDEHLRPWLIEVNTNPCLELSSGLLATIIPNMIENAFRIAVDPLFPPPSVVKRTASNYYMNEAQLENKFELIFHEAHDAKTLINGTGKGNL